MADKKAHELVQSATAKGEAVGSLDREIPEGSDRDARNPVQNREQTAPQHDDGDQEFANDLMG